MEILLDPRSIQWLLASGGVLLVVGGVIWLASLGIFKNTMVVAVAMGAGTALLLGGGIATIKLSRHHLAGRAMALLACLVMPLNLWFYHAHNLVTLDGHLWVAALVCCVLYAIAVTMLEDPVFVYVLNAGVAMTGLLVLADLHKLKEIASPVTLLVSLGLIALHAERAFADNDGPFSRKRFGMACFWSAQAMLGGGFLLLLGAQLTSYVPLLPGWQAVSTLITTDPVQRILAVGLVIAGAYAYLYSDLVVRRVGVYIYIAAANLLWAELLIIDLLHLSGHPSAMIGAMAVTSLAVNIAQIFMGQNGEREGLEGLSAGRSPAAKPAYMSKFARPLPAVGMLLVMLATFVATAGLLSICGIAAWMTQSLILMGIPIGCLLLSGLFRNRPGEFAMFTVAHAATVVLIFSVIFCALGLTPTVVPAIAPAAALSTSVLLTSFFAEAGLFYCLSALLRGRGRDVYLATAMFCVAVWEAMNHFNFATEYYCVTFASLGMALLIAYRLATVGKVAGTALSDAFFRCANTLMSLSFAAAALLTMGHLALDRTGWSQLWLLGTFALLGLVSAGLVRHAGLRRFYYVMAVAEAMLGFVVFEKEINLSLWRHVEMFCVTLGLLLVFGYVGWYREQERQSDSATLCLFFGALLAGLPLAIAVLINRFWYEISVKDELMLATIATLMFITGLMCRLRATTLIGGGLLATHLAMLLVFAGMQAQLAVGEYLAIGARGCSQSAWS